MPAFQWSETSFCWARSRSALTRCGPPMAAFSFLLVSFPPSLWVDLPLPINPSFLDESWILPRSCPSFPPESSPWISILPSCWVRFTRTLTHHPNPKCHNTLARWASLEIRIGGSHLWIQNMVRTTYWKVPGSLQTGQATSGSSISLSPPASGNPPFRLCWIIHEPTWAVTA